MKRTIPMAAANDGSIDLIPDTTPAADGTPRTGSYDNTVFIVI